MKTERASLTLARILKVNAHQLFPKTDRQHLLLSSKKSGQPCLDKLPSARIAFPSQIHCKGMGYVNLRMLENKRNSLDDNPDSLRAGNEIIAEYKQYISTDHSVYVRSSKAAKLIGSLRLSSYKAYKKQFRSIPARQCLLRKVISNDSIKPRFSYSSIANVLHPSPSYFNKN